MPVIAPAAVYNENGEPHAVDAAVVKAVDDFMVPAGFVRKGSREKQYMYSLGVYIEASNSDKHHFFCMADSLCRRKNKMIPCKGGDRRNVNSHHKNGHGVQGVGGVVKDGKRKALKQSITANFAASKNSGVGTDRDETDKEVNVKVRLPAWAKGKSVVLDMTNTHVKLFLKEEESTPIIEGDLRGAILMDGSYWTMETLDDNGKMLYVTLEKAPQLTGLGPWMGVVQGEKQVNSDYPEEDKAAEIASMAHEEKKAQDAESGAPKHTGVVDEDGFCRDLLAVQAMSGAMVARQVPVNGNALFSAVAISKWLIESGEHPDASSPEIETIAKDLRQKTLDYLTKAYKENAPIYMSGESMDARPFVAAQAKANSMADGDEYLQAMRDDTMWGGGGEVVGLTHVLKRPLHVYDLVSTGRRFGLRVIGRFGAPLYAKERPIHIVSTYARFPDLDPGSQSAEGNHYVALYPYEDVPEKNKGKL